MTYKMKSIILASGFGTRLYPLTIDKPKCLLEYKGKPIINHIVDKIVSLPLTTYREELFSSIKRNGKKPKVLTSV